MLSVSRTEEKFLISQAQYVALRGKLSQIMKHDAESKAIKYPVRSLYFDSLDNRDYYEKMAGEEIRKKIRIRSYDVGMGKCKLEIKKKRGDAQNKISLWITNDEAKRLSKGKYKVLLKYFKNETLKTAMEAYTEMVSGHYKPVVMVEYDRIAFTYPIFNTRITFDMNVRSSETDFDLFEDKINYTKVLDEKVILEVKYNGKLMGFISEILKPFRLERTAISKYCLSRINFYEFDY